MTVGGIINFPSLNPMLLLSLGSAAYMCEASLKKTKRLKEPIARPEGRFHKAKRLKEPITYNL